MGGKLRRMIAVGLGRSARGAMRLRGGGSAVPGRVALAISPDFLETAVAKLPLGVIFVSGSNGKSTTTHFLTRMLRRHGLRVFTNSSGGNLPQGIASSMLPDVDVNGNLRADIAVLEVDEAYGPRLLGHLHPRGVLLLNVQVDQLNRFYDPSRVTEFLRTIAAACGDFSVLNADDASLRSLPLSLEAPVTWFESLPSSSSSPRTVSRTSMTSRPRASRWQLVIELYRSSRSLGVTRPSASATKSLPSSFLHAAFTTHSTPQVRRRPRNASSVTPLCQPSSLRHSASPRPSTVAARS